MRAPAAAFLLLFTGLVRVECQGWDKSLVCEDGNPVVAPCVDGVCFLDTDLKCELKKDGTEYCCKLPRRYVSRSTPGRRHYLDNCDDTDDTDDAYHTNDPNNSHDANDSDDHRNYADYANDAYYSYHSYDTDNADHAYDNGNHSYDTNDPNYSYDAYNSNYPYNANNSDYANDADDPNDTPPLVPGGTCVDVAQDCAPKLQLCKNPSYMKVMQQICQKSCGFCTPVPPSTCAAVDTAPDCASRIMLCDKPVYKKLMLQICAATCTCRPDSNKLPPPGLGTCYDLAQECADPDRVKLCQSATYRQLMSKVCARTCGDCK